MRVKIEDSKEGLDKKQSIKVVQNHCLKFERLSQNKKLLGKIDNGFTYWDSL
jgi:hypothetical protein